MLRYVVRHPGLNVIFPVEKPAPTEEVVALVDMDDDEYRAWIDSAAGEFLDRAARN